MSQGELDFQGLAAALLPLARELVPAWLPGGKMRGHEYLVGDLRGTPGESLSINLNNGKWADFAGDNKGGDLISLYAAMEGITQAESAKKLAAEIRFQLMPEKKEIAKRPVEPEPKITMPPPDEPPPTMSTRHFGEATRRWCYRDAAGAPMFYIARYDPAQGKQFVPWSWDSFKSRWCMKSWPAPRPLYGLDRLFAEKDKAVLVVEGEKACDAARAIMPPYVVVTWPGGSKAVGKVDWKPLHGRKLLLWPDADEAGKAAMLEIAKALQYVCPEIKVINIDGQPQGWDVADAAEGGWKWEQFVAWAKPRAGIFKPDAEIIEAQVIPPNAPPAESEEDGDGDVPANLQHAWEKLGIALAQNGAPVCNVDNALRVIEGWPKFENLAWFDVFHQKILTRWNSETARDWTDIDDLNLVQMMQRTLGLRRMSDDMVHKAVKIFAHGRKRNEPKDWMDSLAWDGTPRVEQFLAECFGTDDNAYARAVSKNFWIGMIARVYAPGCKLDNMMILEGTQGKFKSTALAIIGGPWFAEVQGAGALGRELFLILRGKMLIEIGEMAAFSKAEVAAVKQVVSCQTDRYRSPYGRSAEDHPRMNVFVGSTNESEYLRDNTGARRFWPIKCGLIDKDKIKEQRAQLFAEAVARFKRGETWFEMPAEATRHEQEARRQVDEWENIIAEFLVAKNRTTINEIANYMKIEPARLGAGEQRRIGGILRMFGWDRLTDGGIRGWKRLDELPQEALPLSDAEEAPF